jgi:hypothetical protein
VGSVQTQASRRLSPWFRKFLYTSFDVLRMLAKVRSTASKWLLIGGLALIGCSVFYWWKGFLYPVGSMLMYSAFGRITALDINGRLSAVPRSTSPP